MAVIIMPHFTRSTVYKSDVRYYDKDDRRRIKRLKAGYNVVVYTLAHGVVKCYVDQVKCIKDGYIHVGDNKYEMDGYGSHGWCIAPCPLSIFMELAGYPVKIINNPVKL